MPSSHNYLQIITKAHSGSVGDSMTNLVQNVWTYFRSGSSAAPSKVAAVTAFKASVLAPLMNCLSINYLMDEIDYRWIDDFEDKTVSEVSTLEGAVTGDNLPIANCVTLQLLGAKRGSGSHGSKHFGPIAESQTEQNILNAGAITLWNTFRSAYIAGFTSSDSFSYVPFIPQARPQGVPFEYQDVTGQPVASTKLNVTLGTLISRRKSA